MLTVYQVRIFKFCTGELLSLFKIKWAGNFLVYVFSSLFEINRQKNIN